MSVRGSVPRRRQGAEALMTITAMGVIEMKMRENVVDAQVHGGGETGGFSIQMGAKAFSVLSQRLYSDKVMAVVREIACNAYDAHVEAGNAHVPLRVHMPSTYEPYFSIRDFGTGMTHNKVMKLYTTFFASDKTGSNEQIGGLGLGSKAPFAYASQFTVTTYLDGEMRIYVCTIGVNGEPQIVLADGMPCPTDEENGVEVSVSVRAEDFSRFEEKARIHFFRYDPLPEFVNAEHMNMEFDESLTRISNGGEDWRLRACSYYISHAHAVMGKVCYPIDLSQFTRSVSDVQRAMVQMPLEIDFSIGDLDIAPSREALSYDPATEEAICQKLDRVFHELNRHLVEEFDKVDTLWEASLWLQEKSALPTLGEFIRAMMRDGHFVKNGHIFNGFDFEVPFSSCPQLVINSYSRGKRRSQDSWEASLTKSDDGTAEYYGSFSVKPSNRKVFVVDDLEGRGAAGRIYHYLLRHSQISEVYLVKWYDSNDKNHAEYSKQVQRFMRALGKPEVRLASSLEQPPKSVTRSGGRGKGAAWNWNFNADGRNPKSKRRYNSAPTCRFCWSTAGDDFDFEDGGFYIPIENMLPIGMEDEKFMNIMRLGAKLLLLRRADDIVVGANPSQVKHYEEHPLWENVIEYLKRKVTQVVESDAYQAGAVACSAWSSFNDVTAAYGRDTYDIIEQLAARMGHVAPIIVELNSAITLFKTMRYNADQHINDWAKLAALLGVNRDTKNRNLPSMKRLWDAMMERYPMLKDDYFWGYYSRKDDRLKIMCEYIQMVEWRDGNIRADNDAWIDQILAWEGEDTVSDIQTQAFDASDVVLKIEVPEDEPVQDTNGQGNRLHASAAQFLSNAGVGVGSDQT